jgi:hypothetical protein
VAVAIKPVASAAVGDNKKQATPGVTKNFQALQSINIFVSTVVRVVAGSIASGVWFSIGAISQMSSDAALPQA